jgi:hypothetical protein
MFEVGVSVTHPLGTVQTISSPSEAPDSAPGAAGTAFPRESTSGGWEPDGGAPGAVCGVEVTVGVEIGGASCPPHPGEIATIKTDKARPAARHLLSIKLVIPSSSWPGAHRPGAATV